MAASRIPLQGRRNLEQDQDRCRSDVRDRTARHAWTGRPPSPLPIGAAMLPFSALFAPDSSVLMIGKDKARLVGSLVMPARS
jgi:hypothetical protein